MSRTGPTNASTTTSASTPDKLEANEAVVDGGQPRLGQEQRRRQPTGEQGSDRSGPPERRRCRLAPSTLHDAFSRCCDRERQREQHGNQPQMEHHNVQGHPAECLRRCNMSVGEPVVVQRDTVHRRILHRDGSPQRVGQGELVPGVLMDARMTGLGGSGRTCKVHRVQPHERDAAHEHHRGMPPARRVNRPVALRRPPVTPQRRNRRERHDHSGWPQPHQHRPVREGGRQPSQDQQRDAEDRTESELLDQRRRPSQRPPHEHSGHGRRRQPHAEVRKGRVAGSPTVVRAATTPPSTSNHPRPAAAPFRILVMSRRTLRRRRR